MEFTVLQPNITKDFILSKLNQESIMQKYTGLDVSSRKLALSPFRNDHKVTCSFYKSHSGILYFHDFATNDNFDCWNVVMKMFNCDFHQALNIIAKDFGLVKGHNIKKIPVKVPEIEKTESATIRVQIKDYTDKELEWWNQFGVTLKILKKYKIYSLQYVFLNGELKFISSEKCPIYGYYFGKDKNGKELWKCYFPANKSCGIRFINNLPKKILQGYHQLPKTGDLLVITKSMKDVASMYGFGITAVSTPSESTFVSDKQLEEFKSRFKHILVIYDSDRPGKLALYKIRKQYPELNYFIMPTNLKKDFTDTVKAIGVNKMKELIKEFMFNYKFK